MALTQRLEIRQSNALVMTPQLMQAIKLLQLSNLDLAAYVENELEKNPLLERSSEDPDTPTVGETESQQKPDSSGHEHREGRRYHHQDDQSDGDTDDLSLDGLPDHRSELVVLGGNIFYVRAKLLNDDLHWLTAARDQ